MSGPDVVELMLLLSKQKLLAADQINTKQLFTVEVETAVKKFQALQRLKADGRVDITTALLLRNAP